MDIGVLIGIVITVVIGVTLIPVVSETIKTLDTSNMSSGMASLINILPIIVVTMVIIGIGYFVTAGGAKEDREISSSVAFAKDRELNQRLSKIESDVVKIDYSIQAESNNVVENRDVVTKITEEKSLSPKIGGAIKSFRQ
jgi:Tfp pilus assembly protein PilO